MAAGGAFLTLALLGSFTIDIVSGRGWVCIALVIFGRWGVWPDGGRGAAVRRRPTRCSSSSRSRPEFGDVPNELMIASPTSW